MKRIYSINQNPVNYVSLSQPGLIAPTQQSQFKQAYLTLYYSPWNGDQNQTNAAVLEKVKKDYQYYLKAPGWSFTGQRTPTEEIEQLTDNGGLIDFPQINQPGIIVHTTDARILSTLLPSYKDPTLPGEGYPFDNWIASLVPMGTPVRILQSSKDHIWYLIKTASYYGWVHCADVGLVSPLFIQEWEKHPFLVALNDDVPIMTQNSLAIASMRKGVLYPTIGSQGSQEQILIPLMDMHGNAQIAPLFVESAATHTFPIEVTAENIATMAKTFIGTRYGWGGLYQLRDCSSTTGDILAPFAIWLPRNSLQQSRMGEVISLKDKARQEKLNIISKQGVPFISLIHFPGHIALYIGTKDKSAYILQDIWGARSRDWLGKEGRIVVGQTAITTLDFTKGAFNIKKLQLDNADALIVLRPEKYSNSDEILTKTWQSRP